MYGYRVSPLRCMGAAGGRWLAAWLAGQVPEVEVEVKVEVEVEVVPVLPVRKRARRQPVRNQPAA